MLGDKSSRFVEEPTEELDLLINQATVAFHQGLVEEDWTPLQKFVGFSLKLQTN